MTTYFNVRVISAGWSQAGYFTLLHVFEYIDDRVVGCSRDSIMCLQIYVCVPGVYSLGVHCTHNAANVQNYPSIAIYISTLVKYCIHLINPKTLENKCIYKKAFVTP